MKFRNPQTGKIYQTIVDAFQAHKCPCMCADCPPVLIRNRLDCAMWTYSHPLTAARLMGYEVIEGDAPTPECDSQDVAFDRADQSAKTDAGKIRPTLVPPALIEAVAAVREYGCSKYHAPDNWRRVEPQRYRDALYRHWLAYLKNPEACDPESGLPHLWHLACNAAFLIEMEGEAT